MIDLDAIEARIRDCKTYNFGLWNADKLAHEDAPAMLNELRHLRVIASGNQGAIVNSIIERTRTEAPRMIDTYDDQVSEVSFDQGWAVTVHRHGYGCTLEWERRGSLDEHLTDILPSEALVFAAAIAGEFANTSGEVPEPSNDVAQVLAWIDRTLALPMYQGGELTDYADATVTALRSVRKMLDGTSRPDASWRTVEPQGEPSDAQVEAAGALLYGVSWGTELEDRDLVRDALRAAGGVR